MRKLPYLQASGEEYEQAREECLIRDNYTCQFEKLGLTEIPGLCDRNQPQRKIRHLRCHHKKERQHGGTHDLDNLIIVCKTHHAAIHPHLRFELEMKDKVLPAPPDRILPAPPDREL